MRDLRKKARSGDFDAYDEYCDLIEEHRKLMREEAVKEMKRARLIGDEELYERMRRQLEDNE